MRPERRRIRALLSFRTVSRFVTHSRGQGGVFHPARRLIVSISELKQLNPAWFRPTIWIPIGRPRALAHRR
jgi:hypothetical protein